MLVKDWNPLEIPTGTVWFLEKSVPPAFIGETYKGVGAYFSGVDYPGHRSRKHVNAGQRHSHSLLV